MVASLAHGATHESNGQHTGVPHTTAHHQHCYTGLAAFLVGKGLDFHTPHTTISTEARPRLHCQACQTCWRFPESELFSVEMTGRKLDGLGLFFFFSFCVSFMIESTFVTNMLLGYQSFTRKKSKGHVGARSGVNLPSVLCVGSRYSLRGTTFRGGVIFPFPFTSFTAFSLLFTAAVTPSPFMPSKGLQYSAPLCGWFAHSLLFMLAHSLQSAGVGVSRHKLGLMWRLAET
ncbi:uncharacterized protein B0I36DRAFT_63312 [Microdochium trichocladiopsis]|uniref:Uncharacterized protein n=1 Tax=Microdochium trichocladiopsis TaxID=1682393 RepID=A0A9P9BU46_9PEZI|nr:uncharacterized protein B0I36DRAFT_63312 [Microdochium trichocladiopsis]KAH7037241.1 hypothetical protein B0I36DRAFT_63312 [Microdochium trichocladiopsis]